MTAIVYTVSTADELLSVLRANPAGGIEIRLEAGDYGKLALNQYMKMDIAFENGVTITSADPDNPASFSGMILYNVSGMTFDNVVFDYTAAVGETRVAAFQLNDCTDITITNSLFDGSVASGVSSVDDGFVTGVGLRVSGSEGVTISNTEFTSFQVGMELRNSDDLTITGNDMHDLRSDGMILWDVQGVLIEDNYIHDLAPSYNSSDHRDMIQFFTTGTTRPTTDVVIRGNILDIGEGGWSQGILINNEVVASGQAGSEMYYQNIVIENNTIYNSHLIGIYVSYADGVEISNNTLIQVTDPDDPITSDGSSVRVPGINVYKSTGTVEISGNLTGSIATSGTTATVSDNVIIQNTDPSKANYYEDVFVSSSMTAADDGSHSYVVQSDGSAAGRGASQTTATDLLAAFDIAAADPLLNDLVFDAGYSQGVTDGATWEWDFGDGTTATGALIRHAYDAPGAYQVTLTVTAADGTVSQATATAHVTSNEIVSYDVATGRFVADSYGETVLVADPAGDTVLTLLATGKSAAIPRKAIAAYFGSDQFEISLTVKSTGAADDYGELLRLHTNFLLSVSKTGAVVYELTTSAGTLKLTSTGVNMLDGAAHEITMRYDGEAGTLELLVDGTVAASGALTGTVGASASWDLSFGSPWGQASFEGTLSDFSITVPGQSDYASYDGDLSAVPDSNDDSTGDGGDGTEAETPVQEEPAPVDPVDSTPVPVPETPVVVTPEPVDEPMVDLETIMNGDVDLVMSGSGVKASYSRKLLADLFGSDGFVMSLDIQGTGATGNNGQVVMLHQVFNVLVRGDGRLQVALTTTDGTFTLMTDAVKLNDGNLHSLTISYDSDDGQLEVFDGGTLVASRAATGNLLAMGSWDLNFGNPWNVGNFAATISDFSLDGTVEEPVVALAAIADESERVGLSMEITRDAAGDVTLIAGDNGLSIGLTGDGILIEVATGDGGTAEYAVTGLGLDDDATHGLTVLLDADTDRLQVIVDDTVVIDDSTTDFDLADAPDWSAITVDQDVVTVQDLQIDEDFLFVADPGASGLSA